MNKVNCTVLLQKAGLFLFLIYIFFSSILGAYFSISILLCLVMFLMLLNVKIPRKNNFLFTKSYNDVLFLAALLFHTVYFCIFNKFLRSGISELIIKAIIFLFANIIIWFLIYSDNWIKFLMDFCYVIALFFPLTTIIFFIFPDLCRAIMIPIWNDTVGGIAGGSYRAIHRAGFTIHYSYNGIFCAVSSLLCFVKVIFNKERKYKLLLLVAFIGLLLTAKRAHLLFTVFAFIATYMLITPDKKGGRTIKGFFVLFLGFIALIIASGFVPELAATLERFNVGKDGDISSNRFDLWALAMNLFKTNPLLGIGWYGYPMSYGNYLILNDGNRFVNTHNVYIQVLCETGIVGLICYLFIVLYVFFKTLNLIKIVYDSDKTYHFYCVISLSVQIFYLSYSLTGCCLYDSTFYFYAIACAIVFHISRKLNQSKLTR